jgi:hypothetical protein
MEDKRGKRHPYYVSSMPFPDFYPFGNLGTTTSVPK